MLSHKISGIYCILPFLLKEILYSLISLCITTLILILHRYIHTFAYTLCKKVWPFFSFHSFCFAWLLHLPLFPPHQHPGSFSSEPGTTSHILPLLKYFETYTYVCIYIYRHSFFKTLSCKQGIVAWLVSHIH